MFDIINNVIHVRVLFLGRPAVQFTITLYDTIRYNIPTYWLCYKALVDC